MFTLSSDQKFKIEQSQDNITDPKRQNYFYACLRKHTLEDIKIDQNENK